MLNAHRRVAYDRPCMNACEFCFLCKEMHSTPASSIDSLFRGLVSLLQF